MKKERVLLLVSILNIVLLVFVAARPSRESFEKISVKEFELVDKNGMERASIKVESEGEIVLRLRDKTGTIRVKLGADEAGSGLVLLDKHTNPGIHALAKDNGASLTLTDKSGKKKEF